MSRTGLRPWPEPPLWIDTAEIRREVDGFGAIDDIESPLILALCDEVDRLRQAARRQREAENAMLSVVPIGAHGVGHAQLVTAWIIAGGELDDVLKMVR